MTKQILFLQKELSKTKDSWSADKEQLENKFEEKIKEIQEECEKSKKVVNF